jgi:hypothetical protein
VYCRDNGSLLGIEEPESLSGLLDSGEAAVKLTSVKDFHRPK